jgi:hypothetical protein
VAFTVQASGAQNVSFEVFTSALRKIMGTTLSYYPGEVFKWDLRDRFGVPVASGVYYLRVHVDGPQATTRVLKVLVIR